MADSGTLTPRQARFCAALLEAASIREAAKAARIGERTAWTYLQNPRVRAALAEQQDALLGQASRRLAAEMGAALDTLCAVMRDKLASDAARVAAARAVLECGLRLAEMVSLASRVAELERAMTDGAGKTG